MILRHSNVINIFFGVDVEVEDGGEKKEYFKMNVGRVSADLTLTKGEEGTQVPGLH